MNDSKFFKHLRIIYAAAFIILFVSSFLHKSDMDFIFGEGLAFGVLFAWLLFEALRKITKVGEINIRSKKINPNRNTMRGWKGNLVFLFGMVLICSGLTGMVPDELKSNVLGFCIGVVFVWFGIWGLRKRGKGK